MITGIVVLSSFSDVLSILIDVVTVVRIVIVSVSFARIGVTSLPSPEWIEFWCQPIRAPCADGFTPGAKPSYNGTVPQVNDGSTLTFQPVCSTITTGEEPDLLVAGQRIISWNDRLPVGSGGGYFLCFA